MSHLRLSEHINKCLSQHACVAIPEIGGFVLETIPARYDEQENRAYPPGQELHFNTAIRHRDGLLETLYATTFGVSLRRARMMLDEDVKALRSELVSKRSTEINSIGKLSLSDEGLVSFSSDMSEKRQHPDAYGLFPASLPLLQTSISSLSPAPNKSEKYYYLPIHRNVPGIAAAVLLFTALLFLPIRTTSSRQNCEAGFIPTELVAGKVWSQYDKQSGNSQATETEPEEPTTKMPEVEDFARVAELPMVEKEHITGPAYFVVIGSFRTEEQVREFVSGRKEKFSKQSGVIKDKRWYRVYSEMFSSSGDAYTASTRAKGEAWVFEVKEKK